MNETISRSIVPSLKMVAVMIKDLVLSVAKQEEPERHV